MSTSMITIVTGGTVYQREDKLRELVAKRLPHAEVEINDWTIPVHSTVQIWAYRYGYIAISRYQTPKNAPYLPDIMLSAATHGKPVFLSVDRLEDIPATLKPYCKIIDLTAIAA